MNLTVIDHKAFVKVGKCTYLCLGDEEEVALASHEELAKMIQYAMALSDYNSVNSGKGLTLH